MTAGSFFRGEREGRAWRLISREVLLAGLVMLLIEIAARRLSLWFRPRLPAGARRIFALARTRIGRRKASSPAPVRPTHEVGPASTEAATVVASGAPSTTPAASDTHPIEPAARTAPESLGSALSRARRAADKRLGR